MKHRDLHGKWKLIFRYLAISFSLFYLYTAGFGIISTEMHRGMYLLFSVVLSFMLYPTRKNKGGKKVPFIDIILIILTIIVFGYWIYEFSNYVERFGQTNIWDFAFGIIAIVLLLEITRRVLGNALVIIGLFFLIQLYLGPYLPGILSHQGFTPVRIVEYMYSSMDAIFGTIAHTFATFVLPFIILGSFLEKSGAGTFFIRLATSVTKGWSGGPAKVSVLASGAFGSISGSSVANVVASGAFTIPMMIRVGFKRHVAGAIEAAGSTGGQFLPPIMGAGAFLLAAFAEVPYAQIALMNIIPALLYFYWVGSVVHFEGLKQNIRGLPDEEIPSFSETLKKGWFFFVPLIIIVVILFLGYSPALAAFYSVISCVVLSWLNKDTRMGFKDTLDALELGGRNNLAVGAAIGMLGIIMGGIVLAGLGAKFGTLIVDLSGGITFIAIALVALVGLIVGMGATQTATYMVVSLVAVPGLTAVGVDVVTAHIISFWFSAIANVTPPVCMASFAAASIANGPPMKTGFTGLKYVAILFVLPFTFVYFPGILLNASIPAILYTIVIFVIAIPVLAAAIQGYFLTSLPIWQRILLTVAGLLFFVPGYLLNGISIILIVLSIVLQKRAIKIEEQTISS